MRSNLEDIARQTFRPLGTLVVLQAIKVTETLSGIRLPDSVIEKNETQTPRLIVISTGPECKLGLKRGDEVLVLANQVCWRVIHGGERELVVLTEDKILGVVEK
jgi:co-chaperonin GroES (HSP10)